MKPLRNSHSGEHYDPAIDERECMKYKYAFGLLGNARAFVESAVDYARQDRQDQWKFAIVHLTTALELLLKGASRHRGSQAPGGREGQGFRSPVRSRRLSQHRHRGLIKKLTQTIQFSLSNRQRQVLSTLRSLRNRVRHYIDPSDTIALKVAVAAGLNLFIEINHAEFPDDDPYGAGKIPQFVEELQKYDDFVKERLSSLSDAFVRPCGPEPTIPMVFLLPAGRRRH